LRGLSKRCVILSAHPNRKASRWYQENEFLSLIFRE
jgi:hypothetical protein